MMSPVVNFFLLAGTQYNSVHIWVELLLKNPLQLNLCYLVSLLGRMISFCQQNCTEVSFTALMIVDLKALYK